MIVIMHITGVLLYNELSFLQIIEGTRDDVGRLLAKIAKDPRHTGMRIVQDETIPDRDFTSRAMACQRLDQQQAKTMDAPARLNRCFIDDIKGKLSMPAAQVFVNLVARQVK